MKNELKINVPVLRNTFDSLWWNNFLTATKNLTETTVIKNCLTKEETLEMREYLMEIIADLSKRRTTKYGYRLYLDGDLVDEDKMSRIFDSPPLKNEPANVWVKRVFGDKKFGIIINEGERFNLALTKKMAVKTAPLLNKIGFPNEGVNFTLFIGNYGWTPLGIHQDKRGESVIHFHLGPGSKTMYTWRADEFCDLVDINTFDRKDVNKLLPNSTKFEFNEGDLYFMPTGEYHIGNSAELSFGLTFWTYNHSRSRFIKKLHSMVLSQFLNEKQELVLPDMNDLRDTSNILDILGDFEFIDDLEKVTYTDLLIEMFHDLRYSISSNAGYRKSPFPRTAEESVVVIKDTIRLEHPFIIKYRAANDGRRLYVYVRGHKFALNNFPSIATMIDEINENREVLVSQLLQLLDKEWLPEVGMRILGLLYQHHGIGKK